MILELAGAVATVTMDRLGTGNRLDPEMATALGEACRLAAENDGLRLLVLTANSGVFSTDAGSEVRAPHSPRLGPRPACRGRCRQEFHTR